MHPVPDRSSHLPEDSLPSWVFDYSQCDNCEGADDDAHNYAEYGIEKCECVECKICEEKNFADDNIRIEIMIPEFNPKVKLALDEWATHAIICAECVEKIEEQI